MKNLQQLVQLANRLDRKGLIEEANIIDSIVKKAQGLRWPYYEFRNGRLFDEDGYEEKNFPDFKTVEEAEQYLIDNDIRGSVR